MCCDMISFNITPCDTIEYVSARYHLTIFRIKCLVITFQGVNVMTLVNVIHYIITAILVSIILVPSSARQLLFSFHTGAGDSVQSAV